MSLAISLAEKGFVPDFAIRYGIRQMLEGRLETERARPVGYKEQFVEELRRSAIAVDTDKANEQHYEVPSAYFHTVLGLRKKYSATYWPEGVSDLDASEEASLRQVAERAELQDGQDVLELGCGWGSFSLWAAETFPNSRILGVSNSHGQRAYIMEQARQRGLSNLEIRTADMNAFDTERRFDRVVSIEMFEHMKNYKLLMARIAGWLRAEGKLFVHIFTHDRFAYPFVDAGDKEDWMARYFFTGGNMPSADLLTYFQDDLKLETQWKLNGQHYQRTLEAWLEKHDAARDAIMPLFEQCYGKDVALCWFHRWRLFYLACSELFGYRNGEEWYVSHYRFVKGK